MRQMTQLYGIGENVKYPDNTALLNYHTEYRRIKLEQYLFNDVVVICFISCIFNLG